MVRTWNRWVVGVVAVGLAVGLLAPGQALGQAQPPAGADVLKQVPAGCMGFLVIRNVQELTGRIDALIKAVSPPDQPLLPKGVLDMVKEGARLGEGLDANAGLAVVMLDPQQYGLDLAGLISGTAEKPPGPENICAVLLIPGKDPEKMLAAHKPVKDGDDYRLEGETWARQAGAWVLLGPSRKALAAVAEVKKSVLDDLSAADKDLIARNDATVWMNFKVVAPILDAAMAKISKKLAEAQKAGEEGPRPAMAGPMGALAAWPGILDMYREVLKQLDDAALGVRIPKEGPFVEMRVSFLPESATGKALAEYKVAPGALLHRLPDMPYVLAVGAQAGPKMPTALTGKYVDQLLSGEPFGKLSPESKARMRKLMLSTEEQADSMQVYIGLNTAGSGRLGIAAVIQCKSAQDLTGMLADSVAVINEIIAQAKDADLRKLSVKYQKGLDALGDVKLDVISVEHPELEKLDDKEAVAAMKSVLGETKIRIYVAAMDAKTLVITLGGGKDFLAGALKAAAGTGKLEQEPNVAKVLALLPKERYEVILFSPANLLRLIKEVVNDVAAATGETAQQIPFKIESPAPLAAVATVEKSDIGLVAHVPIETLRDIVQSIFSMVSRVRVGPPGMAVEAVPL